MVVRKKNVVETNNEMTFDLVGGYVDKDGTVHKDFEIREMNGTDEEAISKAEVKTNGAKVGRVLIERCCTRIGTLYKDDIKSNDWREIIQNLSVGDQDVILMRIRQVSLGEEIEGNYECPHCKAKITSLVGVDELETIPFDGERIFEFELPRGFKDKEGNLITNGKMRHPNGLDREVLDGVIRKNVGLANTMMLSRCITEIEGTKVHDDFVRNLSVKDRNYLLDLIKEHSYGINTSIELDCPECGESFKASLNAVNFI